MKKRIMPLVVFAGLVILVAFSTPAARAADAPQRIEITAKRFSFDPGEITLKKGQPVVLVLKSADVAHGLQFKELKLNVKTTAHGTSEIQFTPEKTGDFIGHCSVFCGSGHGTMKLTLHVVE
jgi:cytochrome c oxidase subunit II